MRGWIHWIVLVVVFGLGTVLLGWWTVPLAAAAWGVIVGRGAWGGAAAAALTAWAILLIDKALAGPLTLLAGKLAGIFGLPGLVMFVLTLAFPAVVAAAAAETASVLREIAASRRAATVPKEVERSPR